MRSFLCLCALVFVLGRGSVWSDKIDRTCTIPKGAGDVEKCDWGRNNKVIIGGCEENQCLTLSGYVSACQKDGQTVVSASLSVDVDFDTWLGRKTLKDTVPSFDLMVGTSVKTLYVHDLLEGTIWIKAAPDMGTSRVALWAEYVINQDGFCAYIISDQLSVSAPREDSAFQVSDSSNNDNFPAWAIVIIAIGGVFGFGVAFYFGRLSVGEQKEQMVELDNTHASRGSVTLDSQSIDRDSILLENQVQTTNVGSIEVEDANEV